MFEYLLDYVSSFNEKILRSDEANEKVALTRSLAKNFYLEPHTNPHIYPSKD